MATIVNVAGSLFPSFLRRMGNKTCER